jgi:hypothetical protein
VTGPAPLAPLIRALDRSRELTGQLGPQEVDGRPLGRGGRFVVLVSDPASPQGMSERCGKAASSGASDATDLPSGDRCPVG